ncbi:phosphonate metabolism transcriptional regulator PhnF [Mesorhizobium captivum]|uniref:phosphonate metabolism transcriptional regulator PhnF n=1 Tax=Mesorhizobium captivum TaxID=3072319 RepID=UPI002A24CA10|nr:phosphonate metabolism transcriptional regulator PhnF [Mesorhizobium sp. VK3C]MDX8450230.1 phosphonate metabolism transcriptional regulator PhnF [Mesorhizobium sp. VK3C]
MSRKILPPIESGIVDPKRSLPLWRQVQAELELDISRGEMVAGDRFPTEAELAQRFNVHRHTVRRAIEALREKALVRVEHGHGTYVRERTVPHVLSSGGRLSATLRQLSHTNDRRVVGTDKIGPDPAISKALRLKPRQEVMRVDLLGEMDGTPVTFSAMHFPLPRFKGIEKLIERTGSITHSLTAFGVAQYQRRETRVSAKLPTRSEAELLDQPRTQPVLTIWSLDVDDTGSPITYSRSCLSTRWIELVVRF